MNLVFIRNAGESPLPSADPVQSHNGPVARRRRARPSLLDRLGEKITPATLWDALPKGPLAKVGDCIRAAVRHAEKGCFLLIYTKRQLAKLTRSYANDGSPIEAAVARTNAWLCQLRENGHDRKLEAVSHLKVVQVYEKGRFIMASAYFTFNTDMQIENTNTGFEIRAIGGSCEESSIIAFAAAA